jgi:uncharacterized damage-inducible protein DinB
MEKIINTTPTNTVISPQDLLVHWQGHRELTRRMIEAFPEDKLFTFAIGGMRPFSALALEMINMTPGAKGAATGVWGTYGDMDHHTGKTVPTTKKELLERWDAATVEINTYWPQIPLHRFQEVDLAFGQYKSPVFKTLLYLIDNEIHHRGQGYVYLRALGIEPPPFWDRK